MIGLFAQLTPEQQKRALEYSGPENHGPLLDSREYEVIVHALGLTKRGGRGRFGRRWAYRNYFAAGTKDVPIWERLVERGFAKQFEQFANTFRVTPKGMIAAKCTKYVPNSIMSRSA